MIITSDYGSFPHSLLSTSKCLKFDPRKSIGMALHPEAERRGD
jgi:hypothetical protein